jgi:hypothetical protein
MDYVKEIERQNTELQHRLAEAERLNEYWISHKRYYIELWIRFVDGRCMHGCVFLDHMIECPMVFDDHFQDALNSSHEIQNVKIRAIKDNHTSIWQCCWDVNKTLDGISPVLHDVYIQRHFKNIEEVRREVVRYFLKRKERKERGLRKAA